METGSTKKKEKCNETRLAISGKSPSVCISLVFLYPSITGKGCAQQNSEHVLIMPAWDIQPWYPEILDFLTSFQILSRKRQCFKLILEGRVFLQQPTTPSPYWLGKFTQLSQLSPMHESQRLIQITIRRRLNGSAGVSRNRLVYFGGLYTFCFIFWHICLRKAMRALSSIVIGLPLQHAIT